jgi:hypothetical protein
VDFDSDGVLDVLSGSWPGELYFFRGEGRGKFAAGATIKDKDGKVIRLSNASTVFASDWTGDSRLDLLLGSIEGDVYLVPNLASSTGNAFGKARKLMAGDTAIRVPDGDSHPIVADWDSDGNPDLVVGAGDGSVLWYRNGGGRTDPKLEAAQVLLTAGRKPTHAAPTRSGGRGMRAKVCVTDWNGDGALDLLVGDFSFSQAEKKPLSPSEQAAQKQARGEMTAAKGDYQRSSQEIRRLGRPPAAAARRAAWNRRMQPIQARQRKALDRLRQAQRVLMRSELPFKTDGFVWLVTAQPTTVAQQR